MERNSCGKFDCTIAGCDHVGANGFDGPQGLGSHKRVAHGIRGSSPSTLAARRKAEGQAAPARRKPSGRPSRAKVQPNAWGLYDCPLDGCDRRGQNGIPNPQGLGKHMKSPHGPAREQHLAEQKTRRAARARRNRETAITPYVPPFARHSQDLQSEPVMAHVEGQPVPQEDYLNYCPRCKYDLATAKLAIVLEVRAIAFQSCPSCKLNLAVVSLALSAEMQAVPAEQSRTLFAVVQKVSRRMK